MAYYSSYRDLEVWKKSRELVKVIYMTTQVFPKEEVYGLVAQIRRCAVSVPSNIAEGYGRQYKKESVQFFYIVRGSLYELETQLYISGDLGYINSTQLSELFVKLNECRRLLAGLINYNENNVKLK